MRVSEKGDRNLRPKWKRPQALGAPGDRLPPGSPANCNPGARPRPRMTRRVDDMIDSQSQMPALVSSEMVVGGQGAHRPIGPLATG